MLGVVRGLAVEPHVGAFRAVLIETPFIVAACWLACGFAVRRIQPSPAPAVRLAVGALWLALLLLAEVGVGIMARGLSLTDTLASFTTPSSVAGLAAQTVCALFPLVRR